MVCGYYGTVDSMWLYQCGYYKAADSMWLYKCGYYGTVDSMWLYKCGYYKAAPPPTFLAWNRAPASGGPSCRYFARLYMTILKALPDNTEGFT